MIGEYSEFRTAPSQSLVAESLERLGLSVEYFPAYTQSRHAYHSHDFVEFLYVISGTFRQVAGDRTFDETEGNLTIINYDQFHTLLTPDDPVELMNVYWKPSLYPVAGFPADLEGTLRDLIPQHPRLRHDMNRVQHMRVNRPQIVTNVLKLLDDEQSAGLAGGAAAIEALFRLFLIEVCRSVPMQTISRTGLHDPIMERVRRHLDAHYMEPIHLNDLAAISGLRKTNLCGRFKRFTGVTIGQYLTQKRLGAALHMLRSTNRTVAAICHDSGFSDISNFNRLFRRTFGCTPREYRKISSPRRRP